MKSAHDIISSIQHKPQFKKVLHHKCVSKLLSTLLPSLQKRVKHAYVHKQIFYITITASLDKYDKDNIIKTIKMVLNSKMILESQSFYECNGIEIDDVIVYVDHKPLRKPQIYQPSHTLEYVERATGTLNVTIEDPKLRALAQSIQDMIKKKEDES